MNTTTWAVTADASGSPVILAADPNQEEARDARALAEGWTIARLGQEILRARADEADATHVDPKWHRSVPDPISLATGQQPDAAALWQRVTRPPAPGEVTHATRRAF
jgi:hypothetical protein